MLKRLLFIAALAISISSAAQSSFDRGANVIDLRGEVAAYKTQSHDKTTNTSGDGGAASKLLNLSFEHGIFEIVGVGLKVQYDSYFTEEDTIYHTPPQATEYVTPSIKSFDIAPVANLHLVRGAHFDLALGVTYGVSFITYRRNDSEDARAHGTGSWFDAHLTPRFYFGDHFGMHLNLSYARFSYPNVIAESSYVQPINAFSLKGGGMTFGLGFNYKI